ncbi:dihydrofolate reductase family protein [Yinghuangia seranimata]|uniref:dihydrofolate reductase family protein n=1 Tax=Yinghuangia seranimata TaxID=408067 RepID=UPI00248B15E8|nr:dihydrofolate reductase family protein [Yinghuangia seranimata]MDI2126063.1 dihydrofolate reductase family protein [Yinghuangia seranimata]
MKLTVTTFVTLDGVYQAPGGPSEDPSGGFTHGGWSAPFGDEDFGRFMVGVFEDADAFLLGRRTYEIFNSYWPHHDDPADPIATKLNTLPKYVVSGSLSSAEWTNSRILGGDLAKEVAALKEQEGRELQVHGSGALVRSLLALGVVDTLHLLQFPVILGTGKRLFPEDALPTRFRLAGSRTTAAGVAIHSYERDGDPEYGDYADEG